MTLTLLKITISVWILVIATYIYYRGSMTKEEKLLFDLLDIVPDKPSLVVLGWLAIAGIILAIATLITWIFNL